MNTHTDKAQLYTIREVASLSGLPESTLRYYETIGLIHTITRDSSSKHRVYNEHDVNFAVAIACLNATGMSLEDMRTYLKNRSQGAQAANEQVELLEAQKQRLTEEASILSCVGALSTSKLRIGKLSSQTIPNRENERESARMQSLKSCNYRNSDPKKAR